MLNKIALEYSLTMRECLFLKLMNNYSSQI
jgi:hypothetical protein